MKVITRSIFEIKDMHFEIDQTRDGKYWLWLKIRCDVACPIEVQLGAEDNAGRCVHFQHPQGYTMKKISLGYHVLKPGYNELPPLPVLTKSNDSKYLIGTINVHSVRNPMMSHSVNEPILSTPFLIPGESIPHRNLLN